MAMWKATKAAICRVKWEERNNRIFLKKSRTIEEVIDSTKVEVAHWSEVAQSSRVRDKVRLEWKAPEGNKVKLNFDGCSYGNPVILGIGILRNSDRRILGMFSGPIGNGNLLKAELLALLQGLKLVKRLGCRHVEVEGDSKVVISWAANSSTTPWTFKYD
ncbi:PREDICTED: uncharacterized protein LOC109114204 [Nelumbo nucifera]|uniref:Uncharacterized protein LOC109114204 n=1 Tax=Nelumbo nucifera TaxID=4432 RepID=A0A1U8PZT1_NELNU|nr:PREDICTED: uncharacterized protein LOC109114204 [Nelumbo nucifera]